MADSNSRAPLNKDTHWDGRYVNNADAGLSWSEGPDSLSLEQILDVEPEASSIVDIGAGRSRLLPILLAKGYTDLTNVDWSESASLALQKLLGNRVSRIKWIVGDLLKWESEYFIDLWHDRAVFHFKIDARSLTNYLESVHRNVRRGGNVLMATFHLDGPQSLPVKR